MPLPIPPLDERSFQDIVDEAKRKIPQYCPEWTNHNVSDPGVALIELFAWMSEMVLYRVNQVPDRLYLHFLNMVGIDPYAAGVARTDLVFELTAELKDTPGLLSGSPMEATPSLEIPQDTEVTSMVEVSAGRSDPVVFSTVRDLVLRAPRLVAAVAETAATSTTAPVRRDAWAQVRADNTGDVAVFGSGLPDRTDDLHPGDAFYLGFENSLAGMLLRVSLQAETEGTGVNPSAPPLSWQVSNGDDEPWLDVATRRDTTGGLNKPGSIDLMLPKDHRPSTIGNRSMFWLRVVLLPVAVGLPTYKHTPRVRDVKVSCLGGTVEAEHGQRVGPETLGRGDGRPGQRFVVNQTPVLERRAGEHVEVTGGTGTTVWREVEDFSGSSPTDRHYVWDDASGEVRFGPLVRQPDGSTRLHGASPGDGATVAVTTYRTGGGSRGNVAGGTLTLMRTSLPGVRFVTNPRPAEGGVDAETIEEARERAPLTLRAGGRAVTAADYERLVTDVRGVHRTHCLRAKRTDATVRLLVVPSVPPRHEGRRIDALAMSEDLYSRIEETVEQHRIVGTAVEVTSPYYQGVSVAAQVISASDRNAASVRLRALARLSEFVDPITGGPDGVGWAFETDLTTSLVTQVLEGVDGIARVDDVRLFNYDLRNDERFGSAVDVVKLRPYALFLSAKHQVVVR